MSRLGLYSPSAKLISLYFFQLLENHMKQGRRCNMRLKAEPRPGQEIPRAVSQLGPSSLGHPQGNLSASQDGGMSGDSCVPQGHLHPPELPEEVML